VLVVEKTGYFGGTTAYSGGGAWIPNNKHQLALNATDSPTQAEQYIQGVMGDLWQAGDEKVAAFLQSGPEMVRWIEESSQVKFQPVPLPDYHEHKPGSTIGRTILTQSFDGRSLGRLIKKIRYPLQGYSGFGTMQASPDELGTLSRPFSSVGNFVYSVRKILRYATDIAFYGKGTQMANGNALVGRLVASLRDAGVDMWSNAAVTKSISGSNGVIGVQVVHNGKTQSIGASKGVVLATGGFGRSPEAKKYVPHEWTAVPRGNTGDGARIGLENGASLPAIRPANAIFAPISLLHVKNGPVRRYPHFAIDRAKPGSIIVGPDGKRFANESLPYQEFVSVMHDKGIKKAYYIADRTHQHKYGMGMALPWPYPIWRLLQQGYLIKARSITELASKIGVPDDSLEATVAQYNDFARSGRDLEYQRGESVYDKFYGDAQSKPNPSLQPCERGPFYALPVYPGNVSILYGLVTDKDSRVLNTKGSPVNGLYAAGCDADSVFKGCYPGGGSSIGPGMTFGYRAGLHIAGVNK
jgi:hypothetical protein